MGFSCFRALVAQSQETVFHSGKLGFSLTKCSMFVPSFVLEKDEAAIESSEFNATSVADVDKRVKRRLLMGNTFLPLPLMCSQLCLSLWGMRDPSVIFVLNLFHLSAEVPNWLRILSFHWKKKSFYFPFIHLLSLQSVYNLVMLNVESICCRGENIGR